MTDHALATAHTLADADALRGHLDALDEHGLGYVVAGIDAHGGAFLACLIDTDGGDVVVMHGYPWDDEVDYDSGIRCGDCPARMPDASEALPYPVVVLAPDERAALR